MSLKAAKNISKKVHLGLVTIHVSYRGFHLGPILFSRLILNGKCQLNFTCTELCSGLSMNG